MITKLKKPDEEYTRVRWVTYSGPIWANRMRTCPNCSEYTGMEASWLDPPKLMKAVYCVKRVNRATLEEFWGCPNFPKCRYSYNKPRPRYVELFPEGIACHDLQG